MPETTHWEATEFYGDSELRYLVQNCDGKILAEIVHGKRPGAAWAVCIGSRQIDFITEDFAKKYAEENTQ